MRRRFSAHFELRRLRRNPRHQSITFFLDHRIALAAKLFELGSVQNSDAPTGVADDAQLIQFAGGLGNTFAPFGLLAGKHFQEFDLVYPRQDLLFWGARHVDGRGFDSEENRPTNLQIPLVRG